MVSLNFLDENRKVLANLKYECFNKKWQRFMLTVQYFAAYRFAVISARHRWSMELTSQAIKSIESLPLQLNSGL